MGKHWCIKAFLGVAILLFLFWFLILRWVPLRIQDFPLEQDFKLSNSLETFVVKQMEKALPPILSSKASTTAALQSTREPPQIPAPAVSYNKQRFIHSNPSWEGRHSDIILSVHGVTDRQQQQEILKAAAQWKKEHPQTTGLAVKFFDLECIKLYPADRKGAWGTESVNSNLLREVNLGATKP